MMSHIYHMNIKRLNIFFDLTCLLKKIDATFICTFNIFLFKNLHKSVFVVHVHYVFVLNRTYEGVTHPRI